MKHSLDGRLHQHGVMHFSFVDTEGIKHMVEVEAESLFEAAVKAMRTFKQHHCEPGLITKLDVEIRSFVTHTVTPKRINEWFDGGETSPKEAVMKERLRDLLQPNSQTAL